jgi:hypothetical protein
MKFQKLTHGVGIAASAVALLGSTQNSFGQTAPLGPDALNRSEIRPGARALGMGGTSLLAVDDASAAAWNPAAVLRSSRFSVTASAVGRTDNVNVQDIQDVADDIQDLVDVLDTSSPQVSDVQPAFNSVYNFAIKSGANVGGNPARLTGTVTPVVGASFGSYGIVTHSGLIGDATLGVTGTAVGTRTLSGNSGALALSTVAIPFARPLRVAGPARTDLGTIGVSLKFVRADYAAATFTANEASNTITGISFDRVSDQRPDLDIGYITPTLPKYFNAQGAVVIRNLLSPRFSLPQTVSGSFGAVPPVGGNFNFRQRPQIDAGVLVPIPNHPAIVAAELHNLTESNGGNMSIHIGGEYRVHRMLALRAGIDRNQLVGGFGLSLGPARLDLAVGTNVQERFALGFTLRG